MYPVSRSLYLAPALVAIALLHLIDVALATEPRAKADPSQLDEVTVSARKFDRTTLEKVIVPRFVRSHAATSPVIAQLGRWHAPVCPQVTGLRADYAGLVAQRIGQITAKVGAPTPASGKKCAANVEVVFSATPQSLLDHIAKDYRWLLGYYDASQTKEVITVDRPIKAWYVTGTRAMNPIQKPVGGLNGGQSGDPTNPSAIPFNDGAQIDAPGGQRPGAGRLGVGGIAGSHLTEGLTSELMHALIVVDTRTVSRYSLAEISDYVAMLALTRLASLDTCSDLPSITELLSKQCSEHATAHSMTAADFAFLTALYSSDLEPHLNVEQGEIRDRMLKVIEAN